MKDSSKSHSWGNFVSSKLPIRAYEQIKGGCCGSDEDPPKDNTTTNG